MMKKVNIIIMNILLFSLATLASPARDATFILSLVDTNRINHFATYPSITWEEATKIFPVQDLEFFASKVKGSRTMVIDGYRVTLPWKVNSNWLSKLPYEKGDVRGYVAYWKPVAIRFEKEWGVPWEVILTKLYMETQGFTTGAGRRGAGFGVKVSSDYDGPTIKAYDAKEGQYVIYKDYSQQRWKIFSDFCLTAQKPWFKTKYERWKAIRGFDKVHTGEIRYALKKSFPSGRLPDWAAMLLALQIDVTATHNSSYASCGCRSAKERACRIKRFGHAMRGIYFVKKYMR